MSKKNFRIKILKEAFEISRNNDWKHFKIQENRRWNQLEIKKIAKKSFELKKNR